MNHNLYSASFGGKVKFTTTMWIQFGVIVVLFIASMIIGLNSYYKYNRIYYLNNAIDKYNERNYLRAQELFEKAVPSTLLMSEKEVNFSFILAFLNGDIESAKKFNEMLEGTPGYEEEYTLGRKLLWSIDTESNKIDNALIIDNPTSSNSVISNAYSNLHRGNYEKALELFTDVINCKENETLEAPTRDSCVACYNGMALAFIGTKIGSVNGTKSLQSLSLSDMEVALTYFRSAQTYLTPYSPPFFNYDRLYSAYIYRYLRSNSNYDKLYKLLGKANKDLDVNVTNPESDNNHFQDLNIEAKWLESAERSRIIKGSSVLPTNALWKHRVKFLYPAFACVLAELSAKSVDELKLKYESESEKFWEVIFTYYPDLDYLKKQHFVCRVKILQGAQNKQFKKMSAEKLLEMLEQDADSEYLKEIDKDKLEKLKAHANSLR